MTLEIKEGRYYVNRLGEKAGPMRRAKPEDNFDPKYEFLDGNNDAYMKTGSFFCNTIDDYDLIAEWTDPAEEPEWGEWVYMKTQGKPKCLNDNDVIQVVCWTPAEYFIDDSKNNHSRLVSEHIWTAPTYKYRVRRRVTMLVDVIDGKPDLSTLRPVTE